MKLRIQRYGGPCDFVKDQGDQQAVYSVHHLWHLIWMVVALASLLVASPVAFSAEDHGSGGGGQGGGCGDTLGDLIHILRDGDTGQPILAKRWVELPAETQGLGWGYCPVPIYNDGGNQVEIPFMALTCDPDPNYLGLIEEVNYFGRLNGGRTKERNHRMHLDEVISNITQADRVSQDPSGRLMLGFDCDVSRTNCTWATVDSPMESMALYVRLMKYGHIATDPYEIDTSAHGDPKGPIQFHPGLGKDDYDKFDNSLRHLLPNSLQEWRSCWNYGLAEQFTDVNDNGIWDKAEPFIDTNKDGVYNPTAPRPEPFFDLNDNGVWDDAEPFIDTNENGLADEFKFECAGQESLDRYDFNHAAVFLAAAANKTGKITIDLVQYINRILKITKTTPNTLATLDTLPALYRDCWEGPDDPVVEEGVLVDPEYGACVVMSADSINTPNYDLFVDVQELFMDFAGLDKYKRPNEQADVILDTSPGTWELAPGQKLTDWMTLVNGSRNDEGHVRGFVDAGNDTVRAIEYIHNYAIPENLYCKYDATSCP